jgi:hypothetical protein
VIPELEIVPERDCSRPSEKYSPTLHEKREGKAAAISTVLVPDDVQAEMAGMNIPPDSDVANDEKSSLKVDMAI